MGLLRGVARTAVVAGTATAVSNRVSRRQVQRWDAQDNAQTPSSSQTPADVQSYNNDAQIQQLEKIGDLHERGILTDAEFDAQKRQILGY